MIIISSIDFILPTGVSPSTNFRPARDGRLVYGFNPNLQARLSDAQKVSATIYVAGFTQLDGRVLTIGMRSNPNLPSYESLSVMLPAGDGETEARDFLEETRTFFDKPVSYNSHDDLKRLVGTNVIAYVSSGPVLGVSFNMLNDSELKARGLWAPDVSGLMAFGREERRRC